MEVLQHLEHAVAGEGGVEIGDRARGEFGVQPVDQRLVCHPPAHESGAVVRRPGPGHGIRRRLPQRLDELRAGSFEQVEQGGAAGGPVGLGGFGGSRIGQPIAHDRPPEQEHLAEVPEQSSAVQSGQDGTAVCGSASPSASANLAESPSRCAR